MPPGTPCVRGHFLPLARGGADSDEELAVRARAAAVHRAMSDRASTATAGAVAHVEARPGR
jgi:hypothetical protein